MSRRAEAARIETARRAAAVARLVSAGEPPDRAVAWVARWEATISGPRARADWEAFEAWLARQEPGDPRAPPSTKRATPQPARQEA